MSSGFFKQTKSKVIVSYIMLFSLSIIAVVFIYKQITQLTVNENGVSQANQKLFIIGNTITELYEAETLSNIFFQTGSNNSFQKYIGIMKQVGINIDTLRYLTNRAEQAGRLDSIDILLKEKTKNLQALIKARKSLASTEFYDKAIASIESGRDSVKDEQPQILKRVTITEDSSYVKTETKRKGFLGWFTSKPKQDSTLKITVSQHIMIDTINKVRTFQNTDTVVNLLKSVWEDVQEKRKNIVQKINRTEYDIISQSAHITDQLRRILGEYEKEELNNSFRKIEQREQLVNNTTNIIAWIAVTAFLLILFFSFFILRDISRSQRYRRKLEAANLYADELLKSREKLIMTVTHDIKSPLGSIIGYIELLNNTEVTNRQSYFLKNMKSSSEHILNLVTNLLDLSKLESNKMPVEEVVFNPSQVFHEVCDSFMPLAQVKNLRLTINTGKDLERDYKGDALRIRQILSNILSNAVKYTNKGAINFTAQVTEDEKIILEIKDSGLGMTKEEQETIFGEFTRLSSASAIEGTGIGLTITLKLVQLLNGEICLESAPGKGSCFIIKLPLKRVPLSEKYNTEEAISILPQVSEAISKLRILLVDDDSLQLKMTSALLESKGIMTKTTTQPEEVLELIQANTYDIVFSDIQMPEIDGFRLVHLIRESGLPGTKEIPVIALSANGDKNEKDYQQAGFTAYLNKPFSSEQLFGILEKVSGYTCGALTAAPEMSKESSTQGYSLKSIMLFTDNDQEATNKIVESFIRDTQHHLHLFATYIETGQTEAISQLAHKMLPMFRQLETSAIIGLLEKLEHTKLTATEMRPIIGQIDTDCGELIDKLSTTR